jgi:hypothetical protein
MANRATGARRRGKELADDQQHGVGGEGRPSWEVNDVEIRETATGSSSSSSSASLGRAVPWWSQWWPWGELVDGAWAALVLVLGVWVAVASAVSGQGGAAACKSALHAAGRSTFDLICRPPKAYAQDKGMQYLLALASSYLPFMHGSTPPSPAPLHTSRKVAIPSSPHVLHEPLLTLSPLH